MMTYPPDDKEFVPPEWMNLPNDVQLPSSIRMHNLIEKTALFINKHGSQMEILVKAKQAKNPQFDFLEFDSPLNKYYKYLITSMKSGDYVSSLDRPIDSGDSDDDEDHYLHPSLLGSTAKAKSPEKLFLPQLPRVPDENSSYSQLVKSLKDKIIREPEKKPQDEQSPHRGGNECDNHGKNANNTLYYQSVNSKSDSMSILPPPPPEVQLYIDKLAEHVARKGEDFEKTIRKRNESRFEFLNPGNMYHCHYIKRKLHFLDEKRQAQAEDIMAKSSSSTIDSLSAKVPVSFSLSSRENKRTVLVEDDGTPDTLDKRKDIDSDLEDQLYSDTSSSSLSKEKQEERRRKAALFLSLLKKNQSIDNDKKDEKSDRDQHKNGANNGDQNAESPNRDSNDSLSSTIEAVTSPASLSKNLVDHSDDDTSNSEHSSKVRANSQSNKPASSSLLPFKSSDSSKRDKSSSSSPSSSTCSRKSSHHKSHHHHHHHYHHHHSHPHPHHHHRHHGHHHGHHPPTPPHHRHHHHKHHRPHRPHHGRRRRSHSRSHSRSRSRSRSHSKSFSRSRSPSPHRKSRRRRHS